ncbi:MAG: Anti-anti-sigma factor [Marmoricola sp.]|nr:Anti-anti-sigma factor [Marmoricola sp.]
MSGVPILVAESDSGFELTVVDLDPLRAAICAVGELDIAARQDLADVLHQQDVAGRRFVRLDLSQVTFLDCSCLGVLLASHRRFLELHGLLVLSGVDDAVARILRVTGLEETLFIVAADKDPLGGILVAHASPHRVPNQRLAVVSRSDTLTAAAATRDLFHVTTSGGRAVR